MKTMVDYFPPTEWELEQLRTAREAFRTGVVPRGLRVSLSRTEERYLRDLRRRTEAGMLSAA